MNFYLNKNHLALSKWNNRKLMINVYYIVITNSFLSTQLTKSKLWVPKLSFISPLFRSQKNDRPHYKPQNI